MVSTRDTETAKPPRSEVSGHSLLTRHTQSTFKYTSRDDKAMSLTPADVLLQRQRSGMVPDPLLQRSRAPLHTFASCPTVNGLGLPRTQGNEKSALLTHLQYPLQTPSRAG